MERLEIPATRTTPEIGFDLTSGQCRIVGNSIPENAGEFYKPIISWITEQVPTARVPVRFDFDLPYFNSSSVKALYHVLLAIKELPSDQVATTVHWWVEPDDEFMLESAETFEEMVGMKLQIEQIDPDAPRLPKQ